jgi:predicted PurR-regulated permease PerM
VSQIQHQSALVRWAAFFLLISIIILGMILGKQILTPIIFAAFIAILMAPVSKWIEKYKIPRPVAAIICLLIAVIVVSGIVTFFLVQSSNFASDLPKLDRNIESLLDKTKNFLGQYLGESSAFMQLDNTNDIAGMIIKNNQKIVPKSLAALGIGFIQVTLFLAFVPMFLIYRDKIFKFFRTVFKHKNKDVGSIILRLKTVVRSYIIGILLVVVVLSICNSIALYALGIKHALFFAVFAG